MPEGSKRSRAGAKSKAQSIPKHTGGAVIACLFRDGVLELSGTNLFKTSKNAGDLHVSAAQGAKHGHLFRAFWEYHPFAAAGTYQTAYGEGHARTPEYRGKFLHDIIPTFCVVESDDLETCVLHGGVLSPISTLSFRKIVRWTVNIDHSLMVII